MNVWNCRADEASVIVDKKLSRAECDAEYRRLLDSRSG